MKKEQLIVPREKYLSAGVHIGMNSKTADMKRFIYKIRPNGLAVLNIGTLDKRIGYAAQLLAEKKSILIVSKKDIGIEPAKMFAKAAGAKAITGRFMPGTLTNPSYERFTEPDALIVTDPQADSQAITEARQMKIPIIGICDTFNETKFIDLVLPANNKGKKSVALILWAIAKTMAELKGEAFDIEPEEFGYE